MSNTEPSIIKISPHLKQCNALSEVDYIEKVTP
ncbi:DNA polymerase V, partial [Acinetobacter baumannii]|nr:DNA polymerase V [Acinetobacter baumannii]